MDEDHDLGMGLQNVNSRVQAIGAKILTETGKSGTSTVISLLI